MPHGLLGQMVAGLFYSTNVDKTKRKVLNAVFLAAGVSSRLNSRFARKKFSYLSLCHSVLSSQDFQDINKYC